MKLKESLALALGAWLLWSWSAKAEREAEITAVLYSYNGQDWLPLQGATIDNKDFIIGVQWNSITATMLAAVRLSIGSDFFEEAISIAPGDTGRLDFPITLEDGSYAATVGFLVSNNRRVLDSRTATFTVATEAPPPAQFTIDLSLLYTSPLNIGDDVIASARVTNIGATNGTFVVVIACDEMGSAMIRTGTLSPGLGRDVGGKWQALSAGPHTVTATLGETVDRETYFVQADLLPTPAASFVGGYLQQDGSWVPLNGLAGLWGNITIALRWRNDLTTHAVVDLVDLKLTDPFGVAAYPVARSGQGSTLSPGQTVDVVYTLTIDIDGTWLLAADLNVETVS